jgi:hypothetical protein
MEALRREIVTLGADNSEPTVRGVERILALAMDLSTKRSHKSLSARCQVLIKWHGAPLNGH